MYFGKMDGGNLMEKAMLKATILKRHDLQRLKDPIILRRKATTLEKFICEERC